MPGSHKSNYLDLLPPDVRNYERPAPYVLQPAVEAGDVLIFTEALVHGTMPWTADHERRCLLYKYSPATRRGTATATMSPTTAPSTSPNADATSCSPQRSAPGRFIRCG